MKVLSIVAGLVAAQVGVLSLAAASVSASSSYDAVTVKAELRVAWTDWQRAAAQCADEQSENACADADAAAQQFWDLYVHYFPVQARQRGLY